jgi:hypothetical protein
MQTYSDYCNTFCYIINDGNASSLAGLGSVNFNVAPVIGLSQYL